MSGGEEGESLEFTPTWVVAAVCSLIVAISLALERLLHRLGTVLKKKHQKALYEALQKVKEELMLLGFISLLLTVFQNAVTKICVPASVVHSMLPCKRQEEEQTGESSGGTAHLQKSFSFSVASGVRRLLAEEAVSQVGYCAKKGKVPFLSLEAIHHLHIFIFILAIVHVIFCLLTVLLGGAKIRQWKHWEDSISKDNYNPDEVLKKKVTHVHQHAFIKDHFLGVGHNACLGWLHSFSKQLYASVTKADYETLRLGFVTTHCKTNPKFNFYKYMMRALEDDFKQVVGISWYLWIFVVIFLLLNISGWHTYFWIAFIPFALLLAVGTKLEHVITQLAHEVAEKHVAIEGDLIVKPSDEHFWFNRPRIILFLIHFILFQNAFEIAFFFWIWIQFGFDSCIMGQIKFIVPRLVIGVIIQVLCSYSTLPLYAIVTQMGSSFKKAIFDEHVQGHLIGWANKARRKQAAKEGESSSHEGSSGFVQLGRVMRNPHAGKEEDKQQHQTHGSDESALL